MQQLRKFATAIALLVAFGINAQSPDTYASPNKYLQVAFNYGKFDQEGFTSLHSDLGASLTWSSSFWVLKPGTQRFKLGIDVAWIDFDYNYYKVKMISEQGGSFGYTFHQGNIGVQAGLGADFHITRDLRLHARACYNPGLTAVYINEEFNYAFANCVATGLMFTWKHIGLGIDVKFGKAKYKNVDFEEDDDYESIYGDIQLPGSTGSNERVNVNLFSVRSSLVFTF